MSEGDRARRAIAFDQLLVQRKAASPAAWSNVRVGQRCGVSEQLVRWWREGVRAVRDEHVEALGLGAEFRAEVARMARFGRAG